MIFFLVSSFCSQWVGMSFGTVIFLLTGYLEFLLLYYHIFVVVQPIVSDDS